MPIPLVDGSYGGDKFDNAADDIRRQISVGPGRAVVVKPHQPPAQPRLGNDPAANPFGDAADELLPAAGVCGKDRKNPFNLEYESSDEGGSSDIGLGGDLNNQPVTQVTPPPQASSPAAGAANNTGGLRQFEDTIAAMEEKLNNIDNSKFMDFVPDDNSSATPLSGIEEESRECSSAGMLQGGGVGGGPRGGCHSYNVGGNDNNSGGGGGIVGKGIKKLFGKSNKSNKKGGRQRQLNHRPDVDSDEYDDCDEVEDDEDDSYISGEFDEEFDNSEGIVTSTPTRSSSTRSSSRRGSRRNNSSSSATPTNNIANAPIGVPTSNGRTFTTRQLEDEVYLYKLETLNLTDACRDLADQLEEVESKLESVQAQATFRIHALEAELQDGNLGLKSLVKMTSTEMDGRLDALRALGKTATIQASKLKERDSELILVEQRLRKTRRDVKNLKRENKKVGDERSYLKKRLDELEQTKEGLEEDLKVLATENATAAEAMTVEERERMENMEKKLNDTLEQVGYLTGQLEDKEGELVALRGRCEEKEGEILEMKEELDRKGELLCVLFYYCGCVIFDQYEMLILSHFCYTKHKSTTSSEWSCSWKRYATTS